MNQENSQENKLRQIIYQQNYQINLLRNKFFALQEALLTSGTINSCTDLDSSYRSIVPVEKRIIDNSEILVVAFSGMATQLSMPPAEFMRTFVSKNISVIFIKDFWQCWYQKGLLGLTKNVDETAMFLKQELSEINAKKVIFIGTSAGGYASILFGILLNIDEILSFSPQTYIEKKVFAKFKSVDSRIDDINFTSPYLDLSKIPESQSYSGKMNIYYGDQNKHDKQHARKLSQFKSVNLIDLPTNTHNTAKYLKDQGKLNKIFEDKIILSNSKHSNFTANMSSYSKVDANEAWNLLT